MLRKVINRTLLSLFCACALVVGALGPSAPSRAGAAALQVRASTNLRYATQGGEALLMDIYRPTTGRGHPVLILVHGGSWRAGDKSDWSELGPRYAAEGYTVLAVNYRLAPRQGSTLFPGPVEDLGLALDWARRRAQDFRGDPSRIAMLGSSAGAHLTLLAAGADGDRPNAIGVFSPPVDLQLLFERGVLVRSIRNFMGCEPDECPRQYRLASGLRAVDRQYPATFLSFSSEELIPRQQGRLLVHELRDSNVPHAVVELPGSRHGRAVAQATFGRTINFLEKHL